MLFNFIFIFWKTIIIFLSCFENVINSATEEEEGGSVRISTVYCCFHVVVVLGWGVVVVLGQGGVVVVFVVCLVKCAVGREQSACHPVEGQDPSLTLNLLLYEGGAQPPQSCNWSCST